ncbi:uncharacterized protein LOC111332523 [Stylophora pistillata]|nr:uncharacterized protein LOC111332523 [Stylophora pistillata]
MSDVPSVQAACLKTLNDETKGNWDREVDHHLDRFFPDWRNPSRTYTVPDEFSYKTRTPGSGEQAEKKFFELLKKFGERRSECMFVIHSSVFAQMFSTLKSEQAEEFWLTGEHDFVVLHKEKGIIFFQVKAADTTKKTFSDGKKQLEKDGQSLQAFLGRDLQDRMTKHIIQESHTHQGFVTPSGPSVGNPPNGEDCENVKAFFEANEQLLQRRQRLQELVGNIKAINNEVHKFPGFVVMPNCPCPKDSATKPANGVFMENCENVEAFSAWWDQNVKRKMDVKQELFEILVERFVGMALGFPPPLGDSNKMIKKQLDGCMERGLEALLFTPMEQWISSVCGRGKRWLLTEKVKELSQKTDENILVVCSSKPLSIKLAKEFNLAKVASFEDLLSELSEPESCFEQRREGRVSKVLERLEKGTVPVEHYDHIFVYECEDLYGDWPVLFEKLLKDVKEEYRSTQHLWFFFDPNKFLSTQFERHLQFLERGTRLFKVYGSTQNNFNQVKKYFETAVSSAKLPEAGHTPYGLPIQWNDSLTRDDGVEAGAKLIKEYIEGFRREKVKDKEICILTINEEVRGSIISELERIQVQCQNATDCYKNGEDKVVVESIRQFKELDSNVVILYDPPYCLVSIIENAGAKLVKEYIKQFRRKNVKDKEIIIVTINEEVRDSIISKLEEIQVQSQNSTDYLINGEDKVVVESIRQLNRLDSYRAVIMYNQQHCLLPGTEEHVKSLLYLAVSSCVCKLVVITTKRGCKALKSEEGLLMINSAEEMINIAEEMINIVSFIIERDVPETL